MAYGVFLYGVDGFVVAAQSIEVAFLFGDGRQVVGRFTCGEVGLVIAIEIPVFGNHA